MSRIRAITIATALLATIASTLCVYPHQLTYFNEAFGGPENGHQHLLHSNLDWGQDALIVRDWLNEHHVDEREVRLIQLRPTTLRSVFCFGDRTPQFVVMTTAAIVECDYETRFRRRILPDERIASITPTAILLNSHSHPAFAQVR